MKGTKPKSGKLASRISAFESGGGGANNRSNSPHAMMEREGTGSEDNSNSSLGFTMTPTKPSKEKVGGRGSISNLSERITAFEEGQCHNSSSSLDFFLSPMAGKDKFVLEQRKGTVVTIVKEFNSVEEANAAALKLLQEKMERRRQYRKGGGGKKKKKKTNAASATSSKKEEDKKKYKYKDRKAATVNDTKGVWRNVQATPGLVIDPKTYQPPKYADKSDEEVALIRKTIEESMFLNGNITDEKFKDALVDAFEAVVVQPGEVLIPKPKDKQTSSNKKDKNKRSDSDSYFYIVQQGKVDVKVDGRTVDTVEAGRTFGELNLLYDATKLQDGSTKTATSTGTGKKGTATIGGGGGKSSGPTIMASLAEDSDLETKILRLDQAAYRGIVQNFTKKEELEKQAIIKNNPVLQAMIPKDDPLKANVTRNKLTSIMKPVRFEKDGTIKEEETVGDTFFVVQNGHIRVSTSNNQMATYGPGDCFGKRALGTTTNEPNQVKITGLDNGNVYSIDRKTLDKVLGINHLARTKAKVQDPHKLSGFQCIKKVNLDPQSLEELASRIEDETFESGTSLLQQGKQTKPALYLVREGTVTLTTDDGKFKQEIKAGGYFGVEQLLAPSSTSTSKTPSINANTTLPAQWNVTVSKDKPCVIGILPLLECQTIIDRKDKAASIRKETTKAKPIKTPSDDIKKAPPVPVVKKETAAPAPTPAPAPAPAPPAVKNKAAVPAPAAAVAAPRSAPAAAPAVVAAAPAPTPAEAAPAEAAPVDIEEEDDVSPILKERARVRGAIEGKVGLDDWEQLSILGEGEFGEVWLVSATVSNKTEKFALKIQRKDPDNSYVEELIRREIKVTKLLVHPFIVNLVTTYEKDASVYMLMGLVSGGELWDQVHQEDAEGNWSSGVPEASAKFYAIIIADTLKYMHDQNYLYRDLKPENVMLDSDGYPIIVDFGFAKQTVEKTYTFCGTPNYVAPEIVQNVGHHVGADHWALGVLMYEMVSGEHPFYFDGMDQVTLFESIVEEKHYPIQTTVSKEVGEMIDALLEKDPVQRLGVLVGGSKDIMNHKWFKGMDLTKIRAKQVKAPWVPSK